MTDATPKLRLGGMALGNGLLVHGPTRWAAAVRRADGTIATASGVKPRLRGRVAGVPGVRGVARIAEAMVVIPLVKRALPEAKLPFVDARVAATAAAASAGGALLRRRGRGSMGAEAGIALLSVVPALVALRDPELTAYHGAEHKAIGAYEQGEDAAAATKEHDRCGSHLMAPLLAANVAGAALLRAAASRPTPLAAGAVQLASLGAAVEVFAWSERHPDSRATRMLRRPGHELQRRLGTREPSEAQLEVARAALGAVLEAERTSAAPGSAAGAAPSAPA
jgi:uncharacterized protein YqhQ